MGARPLTEFMAIVQSQSARSNQGGSAASLRCVRAACRRHACSCCARWLKRVVDPRNLNALWSRFEPKFVVAQFHQKRVIRRNISGESFRTVADICQGDGQWQRWEAHGRAIRPRKSRSGMDARPTLFTQIFRRRLAFGAERQWFYRAAPRRFRRPPGASIAQMFQGQAGHSFVRRVTSPVS